MTTLSKISYLLKSNSMKSVLSKFEFNSSEIQTFSNFLERSIFTKTLFDSDFKVNDKPQDFLLYDDKKHRVRILYWSNNIYLPFHFHPNFQQIGLKILKGEIVESRNFKNKILKKNDFSIINNPKNDGHSIISNENSLTLNIDKY
jgi:hypothetical protein